MRNRREDFLRSRLRPGLKAATLGGRRGATEPLATTAERNRRGHDDEAFEPASRRPPHRDLTRPPVLFQRPRFPETTYRAEDGAVIDYGNRYPDGAPREAYSRVSHSERFRPLVTDAASLTAYHLTAEGEAERLEDALLAIAGGGLRERYPVGVRRWTSTELDNGRDGRSSSSGPIDPDVSGAGRRHAIATTLAPLDDGWWPAWLLRTPAPSDTDD